MKRPASMPARSMLRMPVALSVGGRDQVFAVTDHLLLGLDAEAKLVGLAHALRLALHFIREFMFLLHGSRFPSCSFPTGA